MFTRAGLGALLLAAVAPLNASLMTRAYASAGADSCDVIGTEYASCTATGIEYYAGREYPVTTGAWARAGYGFLEAHSLGGNWPAQNGTAIARFSDRITIVSPSVTEILVVWDDGASPLYFSGTGTVPGNSGELYGMLWVNDPFDVLADLGQSAHVQAIVAFYRNEPVEGPLYYWTDSGSTYPVTNGVYIPEPVTYLLVMAGFAVLALTRAIAVSKVRPTAARTSNN